MRSLIIAVLGVVLCGCTGEPDFACPDTLASARRLAVVSPLSNDAPAASLATFERDGPDGAWRPRRDAVAAVVGSRGVGWGHTFRSLARPGEAVKAEGDKRTPAGVFGIGAAFGTVERGPAGYFRLAEGAHYCVDDARSDHYSRIVSASTAGEGVSGERMWEVPVYRRGIVIDYPTSGAAKAGSCIFFHIWQAPGEGTSGCVAAEEPVIADLQSWLTGEAAAVAIVPAGAQDRFGDCLP